MILLRALSLLVGLAIAALLLGSALKTVVLPQEGYPRLSQAVFALVHRLMVHPRQEARRGSALRSLYAPVALVSLPLIWMIVIAAGFMCIFWSTGSLTWTKSYEISVSSLTTLGFSEPSGTWRITIAFIEATIGLGLVALLISYLPTIYSAYNSREKGLFMLSPVAGTPPSATAYLQTLHRTGALDTTDTWRTQTDWVIDAEQTHTAFPILTYFPEAHADLSWVATIGTMLDAAALVVSVTDTGSRAVLEDAEKGPLMALVYGIPTLDGIARAAGIPLEPAPRLLDLTAHIAGDPTPDISVSRHEYLEALAAVRSLLDLPDELDPDVGWHRFAWVRSAYDRPLRALAGMTHAKAAPWTTDRPAAVGRPRFMRRRLLPVDWTVGTPLPTAPPTLGA